MEEEKKDTSTSRGWFWWLIGIIIGVIVIVIIILLIIFARGNSTEEAEVSTIVAESGPMEVSPIESIANNPQTLSVTLEDVTGGNSYGTAYILRENGVLYNTVTATLPDPADNYFYEGWLVTEGTNPEFFSTGEMTKNVNGEYVLNYESNDLSEGYTKVVITL